jgi:hypothetical protein
LLFCVAFHELVLIMFDRFISVLMSVGIVVVLYEQGDVDAEGMNYYAPPVELVTVKSRDSIAV